MRKRRLPAADRDALPVLAAGTRRHGEVGGHRVDAPQHFGAVADEVGVAQRLGDAATLNQVGLGGAEHEVARGRVDLPTAELLHVDARGGLRHDLLGIFLAGEKVGVRHPHHRQVRVALAAPVARGLPALFVRPEPVPHVVREDPVLDQDVAGGQAPFVVDGEVAPLPQDGAIVDQRDQRACHQLPDLAGVDRRVLHDVVGLEPVAARLVEEDAAAPAGQHNGQLARGCRAGRQLGQGPRRRQLRDVLDAMTLEDLVPLGAGQGLEAGLHPGIAVGHARDAEPRPDLLVLGQQALRVGDEDAPAAVATADLHLGDGVPGGAGGLVGPGEQLELAPLVHRVGRACGRPARATPPGPAPRCAPRCHPAGPPRPPPGRRPGAPPRSGRPCGQNPWSRRRRPGSPHHVTGPRRVAPPGGRRTGRSTSRRPRRTPRPCRRRRPGRRTARVRARQDR